jgi:hypothetical protein
LIDNRFIELAENRKWNEMMDILAKEVDQIGKEMRDWLSFHYPDQFFQFLHEYLCLENQYSDDFKLEILDKLHNARLRSMFNKEQLHELYWLIKSNTSGINNRPSNEEITLILDLRDYEFVKKIIVKYPEIVQEKICHLGTVMAYFLYHGLWELADWLLQFNPPLNDKIMDPVGMDVPFLVKVISENKKSLALRMIENGVDVNYDGDSIFALNTTILKKNKDLFKLLLSRGADINKEDHNSGSPIGTALLERNWEFVDILLGMNVDIEKIQSKEYDTFKYILKDDAPLQLIIKAVQKGFEITRKLIREILKDKDADEIQKIIQLLGEDSITIELKIKWVLNICEEMQLKATECGREDELKKFIDSITTLKLGKEIESAIKTFK